MKKRKQFSMKVKFPRGTSKKEMELSKAIYTLFASSPYLTRKRKKELINEYHSNLF